MPQNNKILISGTSSGLGKYLSQKFHCDKFDRKKKNNFYLNNNYKTIIHCAFNKNITVKKNFLNLLHDNIYLVQNLINIPHDRFIFLSSVDVYEKNQKIHYESEIINIKSDTSFYSAAKIMQEEIVKKNSNNYLILRISSLLGKGMKENTIVKILNADSKKKSKKINLNGKSTLNFILYDDIYRVIKDQLSIKKNNILNLVSNQNLEINKIVSEFKSYVDKGNFSHITPLVSNKKITKKYKFLNKSSLQNLKNYYKKNYA